MTATASFVATSTWQKTLWQGEPAWVSTQGTVQAVVSETRARLIYLGEATGQLNLLNAPYPQVRPFNQSLPPNQGGHRFWLGPQTRWGWPPLTEWEYSPAQGIAVTDTVLTVQHPRINPAYPALIREYAWEGSRLRCTVLWRDEGLSFFGLHVVAVDLPFSVGVKLAATKEVGAGFVPAQMSEETEPIALPLPAISISGSYATVSAGLSTAKLGFPVQPLVIERGPGWKLALHPGPHSGVALEYPDRGYLSQVWVGDASHAIAELEQLTPYLKGDASGRCASTVYLEALPCTAALTA